MDIMLNVVFNYGMSDGLFTWSNVTFNFFPFEIVSLIAVQKNFFV